MTTQPVPNAHPGAYDPDHPSPVGGTSDTISRLMQSGGGAGGGRDSVADQARNVPIRVAQRSTTGLRGRKYDIAFAVTRKVQTPDGKGGVRTEYEPTDERETLGLAFDNNTLADMEDRYGSSDGWREAVNTKPIATLRWTFALVFERDEREMGAAMLPEERQNYLAAVGLAFAVANGVDPTQLEQAIRNVEQGMSLQDAFVAAGIGEAPQPNG